MKKMYFVRHGLTEMNVAQLASGTTETPLTTEGKKQARLTGRHAKNLHIDYIVCSPLGRAVETAKIIAKEIGYPAKKIHYNSLFIEQHFGAYEGQPWDPDLDLDGIVDAEKTDQLLARAQMAHEFLHTLDAHNILVVSHGRFGRALRHHIADHPFTDYSKINNAEIVQWI